MHLGHLSSFKLNLPSEDRRTNGSNTSSSLMWLQKKMNTSHIICDWRTNVHNFQVGIPITTGIVIIIGVNCPCSRFTKAIK